MLKQALTCRWQSHYPNWFSPFIHVQLVSIIGRGCQSTHRQKTAQLPWDQHELHQYHQINCFESWTDTLQKSIQSWCIPFALQVWYHIRANEMPSNWRHLAMRFLHANVMYRMHLLYSLSECFPCANFVDPVQKQADKNTYRHKASWWHCVLLMDTSAKSSHLVLFFMITSQRSSDICSFML